MHFRSKLEAMRETIELLYSCDQCGTRDRKINVAQRQTESVTDWMAAVMQRVWLDHSAHSPTCGAKKLASLKVPILHRSMIGGPVDCIQ